MLECPAKGAGQGVVGWWAGEETGVGLKPGWVRIQVRVATATKIAGVKLRRYEPERSVDRVSFAHASHAGRGQRAKA